MMDQIGEIVLILLMVLAIIGNYWVTIKIRNGLNPPCNSDVGMLWFTATIGILSGIALIEVIPIFLFTALLAIEMADVMRMRKSPKKRYLIKSNVITNN